MVTLVRSSEIIPTVVYSRKKDHIIVPQFALLSIAVNRHGWKQPGETGLLEQ